MSNDFLKTWVEIDSRALKHNYKFFRNLVGKNCRIMAVVKSNGYGHGIAKIANILAILAKFKNQNSKIKITNQNSKINNLESNLWFGVNNMEEALLLRKAKIKNPILVLGCASPQDFKKAAAENISLTVSSFETIEALKNLFENKNNKNKKIKIHLKIDTGMHRQGFLFSDLPKLAECCLDDPTAQVKIEGIYTHFSSAGDSKKRAVTLNQIKEFKKAIEFLEKQGIRPEIKHCANTAATVLYPESHFDMVRVGIGLYGLFPFGSLLRRSESGNRINKIKLKPALSWKTIISEIKNLPRGSKIGYDLTETLKKDSKVALLPVGYWDGVLRNLSSAGSVLIKGKRAKFLGRVSMNITVVDITGINAKVGDEVILIGKSGKEEITATEVAAAAGTINYEIITRINPLIKRVYL